MTFYIYRQADQRFSLGTIKAGTGLPATSSAPLYVVEQTIGFDLPLDPDEKKGLDVFMADSGYEFSSEATDPVALIDSFSLLASKQALTPAPATIGGAVAAPDALTKEGRDVLWRISGSATVTKPGASLSFIQTDAAGNDTVLAQFALPDGNGVEQTFTFDATKAPRTGLETFRVDGELGAAVLAVVRFLTLSLYESLSP